MRGRVAIDAMMIGVRTDDSNQNGRWEGDEELGDGGGQKPTWRVSVLVGGFKLIALLAMPTTVGVLRD